MYQILRYPLSGSRRDKEIYDEFDCSGLEAHQLCMALRQVDEQHWYWSAKAPEMPASTKSPQPAQNPIIPAVTALLAA